MSIINDKNAQAGGAFFAFKQIGDKLEGTLISKRSTMNAVYGQPQIVYGIKALDGEIWNVGGKAGIDMQMANVKIGQIVGFKFTSIKPATKVGYKDANIVQVYADPNVIDKKWMEENNITELEDSAVIAEAPTTEAPATKSEKLDTMIKNVTLRKLLIHFCCCLTRPKYKTAIPKTRIKVKTTRKTPERDLDRMMARAIRITASERRIFL